jgi:RNA polymerase sigma-70 factor (ECF subfamily)
LDDDRLATLWDRHADQVYAYARRRVGASDAPDVVPEVFSVAVAKVAKVPDEALPWLYRTAWNVIANHWRAEERRARLVVAARNSRDPADDVVESAALVDVLTSLSDADREALLLTAWEGLDVSDAARVAGCTRSTMSVRLHRARRRLERGACTLRRRCHAVNDMMQRLRDANPVPRDLSTGWSTSAEGTLARSEMGWRSSAAQPHRLPRAAVALVAAFGIVSLLTLALVVSGAIGGHDAGPASIAQIADGRWHEISGSPIGGLTAASTIWTGSEVLVWGNRRDGSAPEGAVFDPSSKRWRKIAPSPLGVRLGAIVVWMGDEMLVWGGRDPSDISLVPRADGAVYVPDDDRWRSVPAAPVTPLAALGSGTVVWTGEELVAVSEDGAAAFRPETDSWVRLPDPPVAVVGTAQAVHSVWTGREALFTLDGGGTGAAAATAFDPSTGRWRTLSAPPHARIGAVTNLTHTGGALVSVAWTASIANPGVLSWQRLQPNDAQWSDGGSTHPITAACGVRLTAVRSGAVIVCGPHRMVGLDVANGSWWLLPRMPTSVPRAFQWQGQLAWSRADLYNFTGDHLLALHPAPR